MTEGNATGSAPVEPGLNQPAFGRRTFVVGAVGVAALFAVGGVGKAVAGERALLRPPGAQDDQRLLGACIKCDRCRSVCPENVIDVAHLEDGLVNARTPEDELPSGVLHILRRRVPVRHRVPHERYRVRV